MLIMSHSPPARRALELVQESKNYDAAGCYCLARLKRRDACYYARQAIAALATAESQAW